MSNNGHNDDKPSNVLAFKKPVKTTGENTMCRNNHHKWAVIKDRQFDVKAGKLVTVERCKHCGKQRNRLT